MHEFPWWSKSSRLGTFLTSVSQRAFPHSSHLKYTSAWHAYTRTRSTKKMDDGNPRNPATWHVRNDTDYGSTTETTTNYEYACGMTENYMIKLRSFIFVRGDDKLGNSRFSHVRDDGKLRNFKLTSLSTRAHSHQLRLLWLLLFPRALVRDDVKLH